MATLVVESDEPRETHHFACLLGYGAEAICPRLALQTVASLAADDRLGGDRPSPAEAQARYRRSIEDGVLKVMSKMGISDVASYCGAQIFDALGLDHDVVERCFPGTASTIGGIGLAELEAEALARARGRGAGAAAAGEPRLREVPQGRRAARDEPRRGRRAPGGRRRRRTSTRRARAAAAVRPATGNGYATFAALVNGRDPIELRDLLELARRRARPARRGRAGRRTIVRRFSSGGMSLGALSPEAHEAIAEAFNNLGAPLEQRRGRRGPGPLPHRAQLEDQADRLGPLRRDQRVRGVRRGAADQDRAGLEARRGRPAARATRSRPRSRACATRSPAWR